ncbi:Lem3/Cdc50 [Auriscalpium vulgare]|uniref:Lem3/Cdc50 n=1 Tax=Auriscalpium vulgare TaxID=40419 RepID=A0ACB8RWH0_9AGAM|nr:Lem3/Cdc50 [Auriscalpium vulgare]
MPLFRRSKNTDGSDADKKDKGSWKRPANTAFKQQRLKAWQPILTPKTVLPTLFIIGILFAPIGGLLVWGSSRVRSAPLSRSLTLTHPQVSEITIDYTDCDSLTPSADHQSAESQLVDVPHYNYRLRSSESGAAYSGPKYAFIQNSSAPDSAQNQCIVQFDIPYNIDHTVLLYYKLTNFFQNHRRYVQSYDPGQLKGDHRTVSDLKDGNCKPVAHVGDKVIYPCGIIANSLFNDTFSNLTLLNPPDGASSTYDFSEQGIAWPGEAKKYKSPPGYNISEIIPPPNWAKQFPDGYTTDNPPPDLHTNEHFQNWMRTAGLPTFTKLFGRNDNDQLVKGRYEIVINMNYPVRPYSGTKSLVISTVTWIGGKNPFLGWAYVAAASLFVALAVAGTIRHVLKPRRLGDMSLLSWNRPT